MIETLKALLKDVGIDEQYVKGLAERFEKMTDGHLELVREIPLLNNKLDTLCEQLKNLGEIAKTIPVLMEREARLQRDEAEHDIRLREHAQKLEQFSVVHAELRGLKWGMGIIISMLLAVFAAVLKHIFG
jgi:SMC interacting uncharacterized protein involved in chromosome segregation